MKAKTEGSQIGRPPAPVNASVEGGAIIPRVASSKSRWSSNGGSSSSFAFAGLVDFDASLRWSIWFPSLRRFPVAAIIPPGRRGGVSFSCFRPRLLDEDQDDRADAEDDADQGEDRHRAHRRTVAGGD